MQQFRHHFFHGAQGLSVHAVERLRAEYGENRLPQQPQPSSLRIFLAQFTNPLVYVLLAAGVITLLVQHPSDTVIIGISILMNTILGFIQEKKANQSFAALQQFISLTTEVIRAGVRQKIDASQLVPQDIVVLSSGAKVPADGVLLYANRVFFDEAVITGESAAVTKSVGDPVYMGTTVRAGQAGMKVTATGVQTKIGAIAQQIQQIEADTPLKRQLSRFSQRLVVLIMVLLCIVVVIGVVQGKSWIEMLTTAVSLAVSSIPEGLLVSLTVVLAVGMQRILRRKGLVKRLSSAETLGGVTTICLDKTGTITEGTMRVVGAYGATRALAQQVILANDLDDPIVIAAYEWGQQHVSPQTLAAYERMDSIPFSSHERFFASLHRWNATTHMIYVNGAPDTVIGWTTASAAEKKAVLQQIDALTKEGRRVIGFAKKKVSARTTSLHDNDVQHGLEWVGVLAFFDPVRTSVKKSLQDARQAGISLKVITGDYATTAAYVLREIGIDIAPDQIITGDALATLSAQELQHMVSRITLFARTTPEQKYAIVTALQQNHEVVGMMGDGVNDAPAIHQADIGIAVNTASDVARESADLVLLDSDFRTVVAAIEEGRVIFDNIRKITLYLLSDAFAEIIVVLGSLLLQLPLPITAVQIIWINLVSDGFPGLALTIDQKKHGVMREPPRPWNEQLVNGWMKGLVATVSVCAGGIALVTFVVTYTITGDVLIARSMTFLTLSMNSLAYVFSVRSLLVPFWKTNPLSNPWLIIAVMAGMVLQYIPFATATTRSFFGVAALSGSYWLVAGMLAIAIFLVIELVKTVVKGDDVRHHL